MQTIFNTISELNAYVPNCLICSKPMQFIVDGYLKKTAANKSRWDSGNEHVKFLMKLEDGIMHSKHKSLSIAIDINNNLIIDGQDTINRMLTGASYLRKTCPTCHFKIHTVYSSGNIKKEKNFPALTLQIEELHYTMKGGKDVRITKSYNTFEPEKETLALIRLCGKTLPAVPFNFNKLKDLHNLNTRIATIKLFH